MQQTHSINRAVLGLAQQAEQLATAVDELLLAATRLLQAASDEGSANLALNTATSQLKALQDANAASHLASQHAPGQPCPVCNRALPDDFAPREIVGEQDVLARLAAAQHHSNEATDTRHSCQRSVDVAHHKLLRAAAYAGGAVETVMQLVRSGPAPANAVAPETTDVAAAVDATVQRILDPPAQNASLPTDSAQEAAELVQALTALTGLDTALQLAAAAQRSPALEEALTLQASRIEALEAAKEQAGNLTAEATRLATEHSFATESLEDRRRRHQVAAERTTQAAQRLVVEIRELPALLSEPLARSLKLNAPNPDEGMLDVGEVPPDTRLELHHQLESKQGELDEIDYERDTIRTVVRDLTTHRELLRDTRRETVEEPRAKARRSWERAGAGLANLANALDVLCREWEPLRTAAGAAPLPTLPEPLIDSIDTEPTDKELTTAVTAMQSRLQVAVTHVGHVGVAAEAGITVARSKEAELLSASGASTSSDLNEQLAQARHELRTATELHDRAEQQLPLAKELDSGIANLRSRAAVLRQVKDLSSPSGFPRYAVQQRQVALLRIASSLLGQLTRDGYGFGDDFMIVDLRTGQPRHPKTLSGGETFLASLALALALVEISNRSGGQLDCLFLDEGFGSLDSSILGEALDVLRLQATGGRLVGVISHLHAVAAELDDVLVVTKEVEGSSFRWLEPEERDAYLVDEAAAGLLS